RKCINFLASICNEAVIWSLLFSDIRFIYYKTLRMRHALIKLLLVGITCATVSCGTTGRTGEQQSYEAIALTQSAIPIRPGLPGERTFWNGFANRFLYAAAFDFGKTDGAAKYRFELVSHSDSSTFEFGSDVPYAPLTP